MPPKEEPKKLKVIVIKALPSMWYNDKIGRVYEVTDTEYNYYNYGNRHILFKEDVKVVLRKMIRR